MALCEAPPRREAGCPSWFAELSERPLIYATIGTVMSIAPLIRWLIDGLSPLDAEVVITTGTGVDPGSLGPLPENVHVERLIPQSLLLAHSPAASCWQEPVRDGTRGDAPRGPRWS